MSTVLFALGAALAYGLSDFIGGLASRRTTAWPVAMLACTGALLGSVILAIAFPGHPSRADFGWAVLAGVGSGMGSGFLYRGLANGRMGVVAPISAVGAAVIPVVFGLVGGERPAVLIWLGIALALPAIWLVSSEPSTASTPSPDSRGALDGILAGTGFGLLFAAIGQVPASSGYWPLSLAQVCSVIAIVLVALLLGGDPRPRARSEFWGLFSGLLASLAVLGFIAATDRGLLTVSAVLTSLYPAATVLLAATVLREHIHRTQAVGLALCAASVVLVAAG